MSENNTDLSSQTESEEVHSDEPQFSVEQSEKSEKKAASKKPLNGIAILAFALVFCLVAYMGKDILTKDDGGADTAAQSISAPEQPEKGQADYQDYQVGINPTDTLNVTSPYVSKRVNQDSTENPNTSSLSQRPESMPPSDLNVGLMQEVTQLTRKVQSLQTTLEALQAQLSSVERGVSASLDNLTAKSVNVTNTLKALGRDGQSRAAVLADVAKGIKGFQVDIQEQRQAFNISILHTESWGGVKRLVAYDKGAPNSVYKLSEGETKGFWTLESIEGNVATFAHEDGIVHEEVIK